MASKSLDFKKVTANLTKRAPGLIAGSVVSNYLGNTINKTMGAKANPRTTAALQLIAGALLPGLAGGGGKKDDFITAVGDGMMANGGVQFLKAMGVPGIGDDGEDAFAGLGNYGAYAAAEDAMYESESMSGTNTDQSFV